MRLYRGWVKVVAAGIVLTTALAGCGGGDDDGGNSGTGDSGDTSSSESATPTPTPSGLSGNWAAVPGQADKVQQALTAKGFECTKSSDPAADLRVCSISRRFKAKYTDRIDQANLRYLSDPQGTVVLAAFESAGNTDEWEKPMAEAVLPASDAAVFLAGGETLSWGTAEDGQDRKLLTVKGWTPDQSYVPAFKPLATTKEKALPALQAAKLKCQFSETDKWGTKLQHLQCSDPAFKVADEDGSIAGATSELILVDEGAGIRQIRIEGAHSRQPAENSRAIKEMVPRLLKTDGDPDLQAAGAWILKHLNGLPHSGYVGQWRVDVTVVPNGGIAGWPYVSATLSTDKPDLGKEGSETPTFSPSDGSSDSPSDGMSDSPSETPTN